jgi:hypothetical protein
MSFDNVKKAFYGVVLATALVGSVTAAEHWLKVPWLVAIGPIAALELGGVVLMRHADMRRQLGERALGAVLLSAGFAGGGVAINYFGHLPNKMLAYFFAGFSAAGYLIYLTLAAAARRDALRAAGKLEATAPLYGVWQWLRHPGITRRARLIAMANAAARLLDPTVPVLGRGASLSAACEQVRAEKREKAIASALDKLIRDAAGPVMADIAVHTYDPDQIAQRIAASADYDGYAGLLSGRLTPAKLAGDEDTAGDDITALADAVAPTPADDVLDRMRMLAADAEQRISDAVSDTVSQVRPAARAARMRHGVVSRPRRMGRPQPQITVVLPDPKPARTAAPAPAKKATSAPSRGRPSKAQKVATFAARMPGAPAAEIAKKAGVSADTVRRHLATAQTVNGHDHGTEK